MVAYRTFRLLLLEATHQTLIKKLQQPFSTHDDKQRRKNKGPTDKRGKKLEEYLLESLKRQNCIIQTFDRLKDSRDIVTYSVA